jgi:hypothetical protein
MRASDYGGYSSSDELESEASGKPLGLGVKSIHTAIPRPLLPPKGLMHAIVQHPVMCTYFIPVRPGHSSDSGYVTLPRRIRESDAQYGLGYTHLPKREADPKVEEAEEAKPQASEAPAVPSKVPRQVPKKALPAAPKSKPVEVLPLMQDALAPMRDSRAVIEAISQRMKLAKEQREEPGEIDEPGASTALNEPTSVPFEAASSDSEMNENSDSNSNSSSAPNSRQPSLNMRSESFEQTNSPNKPRRKLPSGWILDWTEEGVQVYYNTLTGEYSKTHPLDPYERECLRACVCVCFSFC